MVAQFLRLKLRLFGNLFRRSPWQLLGMLVGFIYGIGAAIAIIWGLVFLREIPIELARSIVIVAGSLIVFGFLVVPLVFGADDSFDPRKFSLFGIPHRRLAFGLVASAFLSVPALAITAVAIAQVVTWSRDGASLLVPVISAFLIVLSCVFGSRVSTDVASFLLSTRRAREVLGLIGLLLLSTLVPLLTIMFTVDWKRQGLGVLHSLAEILAWTPLGAAWAAPSSSAAGDDGAALAELAIALGFLLILWVVWRFTISAMLVASERVSLERRSVDLGWFEWMPSTPAGVVAARSLSYWVRDSRYRTDLVIVPIVPALVIGVLVLGGMNLSMLLMLTVPIMCLFLGWSSMHNNVAYDNTAVWLHVASNISGWADRLGRVIPPLILGLIVILFGAPLSAWRYWDADAVASIVGVSVCVLLAGLGVSSVFSAALPYPAVHPGDSPFAQPQSSAEGASWIQGFSFVGILLLSAPTIWLASMGIAFGGTWNLAALLVGIGSGLAVLAGGILLGGKIFDRRAPELLAYTSRY